jgi:NitT/TauT family transport system ATP-binding protein
MADIKASSVDSASDPEEATGPASPGIPEPATSLDVPVLSVQHLAKSYRIDDKQTRHAIGDISLEVRRGDFLSVVGSSGVGKTTLIRCLSGLLKPTSGTILFEGAPIQDTPIGMGLVFQDYSRSLFPWWTVGNNVTLGLRRRGVSRRQRREAALEALGSVGLANVIDAYPWQLSGGMQQRVAIARALAYQAEMLLMDEPYAALDAQTRYELEDLVLRLNHEQGLTVLFVTHDIDEAVYLADRVVVLGGSPSSVVRVIDIPLGRPRDQHGTRGSTAFSQLRTEVLDLLPRGKAVAEIAADRLAGRD